MSAPVKKTKGRQKIEMKKIENEDDRLITFSKRRSGIYKKASELTTLCGAEIAVIVFSPAGKPFSFGHPSVESVANRFLNHNPPPNDNTHPLVEAHRKIRINQLTRQHNGILSQLDVEKERAKMLNQLTKSKETDGWWEVPIDQLNQQELHDLYLRLGDLRNNLLSKMNEKSAAAGATSSLVGPMDPSQWTNPFHSNTYEEVPTVFAPSFGAARPNTANETFSVFPPGPGFGPGGQQF